MNADPPYQNAVRGSSRKSTSTILLSTCLLFLPLVAFSAVLLGLVFHYKVAQQPSVGREVPGGFYLVDFPAAKLIFISSRSSSVAPKLTGVATSLFLYQTARSYIRRSSGQSSRSEAGLPTPYQLSLIIGLAGGSLTQFWKYLTYRGKGSKARNVSLLKKMSLVVALFQLLGLLIFALDSIVHFTTEAVAFNTEVPNPNPLSSFGQGLTAACGGASNSFSELGGNLPCTYNIAATGDGLSNGTEVSATVNGVSTAHHLLNTTILDGSGNTEDLIILGPGLDSIPQDLEFETTSVGVATSCQPASLACGLAAQYGASTSFHCSDAFYGNIQIPEINSTADMWFSSGESFIFGAEFFDSNFSQPYANHTVGLTPSTPVDLTEQPSSFYLALAVRTAFGTSDPEHPPAIQSDPEIITPQHGGLAFILSCKVSTYDVTYTYSNGSVTFAQNYAANGSTTWLWNSVMGLSGTAAHLQQGIDIATSQATADDLARTWSRYYSEQALAILASAFDARPNLKESIVQSSIVTKIARGPLLALVGLNVLFALLGLAIGLLALARDSSAVTAVAGGLGVEGLVAMIFEREGAMIEGRDVRECYQESTIGDEQERVGLQQSQEESGIRWRLVRSGGEEAEQVFAYPQYKQ